MARKNALISITRADNGLLTFTVGNAGSFDFDPNATVEEIRNHAMVHGFVQKISDAAAMPKSETDGKSTDEVAEMKFNAMKSVADRLTGDNPEWSKRSGDGSGPVAGIIYRAFEEWAFASKKVKNPTDEQRAIVRARYDAMSRAEQLALRSVKGIADIMERIRAEKGEKSGINTDELLADIGL